MINTSFYLRRLHSLCGLVLLGGVLIEHILTNAAALGGPAVFNGEMQYGPRIPSSSILSIMRCDGFVGNIVLKFTEHHSDQRR